MKEAEYNKLCKDWDNFIAKKLEYLNKRKEIINSGSEDMDKELEELEIQYHQTSEDMFSCHPDFFGPETCITDLEDLINPDFKLPGRCGRSFSELQKYPEIIEKFGEVVNTKRHGKCRIIGFMYDSGDDYILLENIKTKKRYGVFSLDRD